MQKSFKYGQVWPKIRRGKGKGVGVFFRRDAEIQVCEEELYQFIRFKSSQVTIFCLYVSKGCNFGHLVQSLKNFDFNNKNETTCLIGDLNFDVLSKNDLSRYLSSLNFIQLVNRATHLDGNTLDHVYVTKRMASLVEVKQHYVYYSDHDGIMVCAKEDANLKNYVQI